MKPKMVSILICLVMVGNIFASITLNFGQISMNAIGEGFLVDSPWPMFRGNLNHTGLSLYNTSGNNGQVMWSFETGGIVTSSPSIGSDGTIYVGSQDNNVYAVNPEGTKKWNFPTALQVHSTPAIDSNGTIYVGSQDLYLYAIKSDGTEKWKFYAGADVFSSPVIDTDGTIYFGSTLSKKLYAINPNGTEKWSFTTGWHITSSPAISSDGTIYIGSQDDKLYAINPDGTEKWSFTTGENIWSSPAIGSDGTIYIGSYDKKIYAINPNGNEKWNFTTGDYVYSSPAIGTDGTIYVGSWDNKLYAIYPNGTQKWSFLTTGEVYSSPAIGSDGTVYVGSSDNKLYAINPDGTEKWNFTSGGNIESSPAIGSDGMIYVGSGDKKLYAIGPPNTPPVAEAGPDQTVNEGDTVHFKGCGSYDPDGIYVHYGFDTSDEGFVKETEYPLSDVHWDATNGNVYFKADNSDPGDEIFTKSLDFPIDENSGSWNLSARTMITDPGVWQDSYLLFLADSPTTEIVNSPNTLSFEYFSSVGGNPPLRARYIDSSGVRRISLNCPSTVNTEYILRASYNYGCKNVTMQILDDNEVVLSEGSYIIGTTPSDGFTFEKIGVGTDGYSGTPHPVGEGWTDDIGFRYYSLTYEWDFDASVDSDGDGNFTNDVDATGPTPTHIYGDNGVYTVTLTVTDDDNLSATDTCGITVNNVAPTIDPFGPFIIDEGVPLTIGGIAADQGSDDLNFTWDWDDGTAPTTTTYYNNGLGPESIYEPVTNEIKSPWGVYPFSAIDNVQHTYNNSGVYTITLTVEDDDGGVTIYITNISVIIDVPPTLYIKVSQDGKDVILYWDPPSTTGIDHYLIYRSTSQISFDFNTVWVNTSQDNESGEPGPIPLRTMWNDTKAALPDDDNPNYEQQYYYIIRTMNIFGMVSRTSRTVGKWTTTFPQGVSTFSLPLEPLETMNMTIDYYLKDMNARYLRWMDPANHIWKKHGDGAVNDTQMEVGKGYEVAFDSLTNYTFLGMPGAMISYDDDSGFLGFDPDTEAKNLTASVDSVTGNVTLNWPMLSSKNANDQYHVLRSTKRDGFWSGNYLKIATLAFDMTSYTDIGNATEGTEFYYMIIPVNETGVKGASTYSIGVWTGEYTSGYDTFGIPLKLNYSQTADWYCDIIPYTVGINFFNVSAQWWSWHSTRMPQGAFDPTLEMTEGYQISIIADTKYGFIGI